jgi:hypothetical protein
MVTQILQGAKDLIERFGWEQQAYHLHGARPRCIRKAVWDSAYDAYEDDTRQYEPAVVALNRISEAIHGRRGVKGGINDWEYRKKTDKAAVIELLEKAIELGPDLPLPMPEGVV